MLEVRSFENAASLIRSFGGQVVMSLAVSAAVAGILAVPQLRLGPGHAPLPVPEARIDKAWGEAGLSPVAADGKIRERLRDASDGEPEPQPRQAWIRPASLAMPMSVGWPQPAFSEGAQIAALASEKRVPASAVEAPSPRKAAIAAERTKLAVHAAPMPITPPLASPAGIVADAGAPRPADDLLGRVVVAPVARAADAVSGAAGLVGAAGSWTVSQAASLLPRW